MFLNEVYPGTLFMLQYPIPPPPRVLALPVLLALHYFPISHMLREHPW